jgi:mono/diheme cytochrome c family protein
MAALALSFSATTASATAAEKATFSKDVAPIIFDNCVSCHRPGELAPMALRNYKDVRPWARGIKNAVTSKEMPPWFANPEHGSFKNDPTLTADEIATVVAWVDAGAPEGDPADLPELPAFTEGWALGEPDYIVELPEVTVPATGPDYYPDLSFTMNDLPEQRWIRAIEVRPGNRNVTHHSVIFTSGNGGQLEGQNREGAGFFNVLAVWSVGTNPHVFPEGVGRWMYPGQRLTVNAHYHPSGTEETDVTRIGLYWGEGELKKELSAVLAGTTTFEIPAHASNHELRASYIIDQDSTVISYFPHMHVRGKDMKLTAHYPTGETEVLIDVPEYDFDWQLFYYPTTGDKLPAGTRLDILAHYDNSELNPDNPDPNKDVTFGTQTNDEMMFAVFEFIADEGVSPIPSSDERRRDALIASLPADSTYNIDLPMMGRTIPTALHLPKTGEGTWYILMQGNLLLLPAKNVAWDGSSYSFDMQMRLGPMGGDFVVKGTVDGSDINGGFEGEGVVPFSAFEGRLTGDN